MTHIYIYTNPPPQLLPFPRRVLGSPAVEAIGLLPADGSSPSVDLLGMPLFVLEKAAWGDCAVLPSQCAAATLPENRKLGDWPQSH